MIGTLSTTIAATDTNQRLSETSVKVNKVWIQAHRSNSGQVFVGDEDNLDQGDSVGFELIVPAQSQFSFPFVLESTKVNDIDLMDIWVAGTKDDIVNITYWIE